MAKIIHAHPLLKAGYEYHVFTNLDFWDARRILGDLATVQRNFGHEPPGDCFPTQVVMRRGQPAVARTIERRLQKAIPSPPRHVVVEAVLMQGFYDFDPLQYYPPRWPCARMIHFSRCRLPIHFPPLSTPHREMILGWFGDFIRIERVQRGKKFDPVITSHKEAKRRRFAPLCF